MKIVLIAQPFLVAVLFGGSIASANPSMLPQHPGYPMGKAVDPVRGQSLANDSGRKNVYGEKALARAAGADVGHVKQDFPFTRQDKRILDKPGAGIPPNADGQAIKVEPPVKKRRR